MIRYSFLDAILLDVILKSGAGIPARCIRQEHPILPSLGGECLHLSHYLVTIPH